MECNTLINIIGKYNHYNILASLNLKPKRIIFIRTMNDVENYENTKAFLTQRLHGIKISEHIINEQSADAIAEVLHRFNDASTFLNLSGGSKLMGLLAFKAAQGTSMELIYMDNDNKKILALSKQVQDLMPIKTELTVEDIVSSTGGEILKHSSDIYDRSEFRELIQYLIDNYEMWKLVKDILRNSSLINQYVMQPMLIEIETSGLSYMQLKSLDKYLKKLAANQIILDYELYYGYIEFTFSSREAKSFIMTAGSWLEALTYSCVKELREVGNAISGMLFVWDEELQVHNELDVVASIDSHLVCISCKDTNNYDVEDLNELEVYADHLGGRKVAKILVSTQHPGRGEMIFQRAEEMGINIVIFEGDVNSFKRKLHKLLINGK